MTCSVDSKKWIVMSLLDLGAAFDTVDHQVMLRRLENCFGVSANALEWLKHISVTTTSLSA